MVNNDINALITAMLNLGVDITKAYKLHKGVAGYVDTIANDKTVMDSLKVVIENITNLPADFKALTLADGLQVLTTVILGVENIVIASKA